MTPLVLIPGMMCDARLFGPQIAALSGKPTLCLAPITAHDTVQGLAQDILEKAPLRFALAGLSMGGIVAMEVLRQAPERVERVAFLDTNPLAEQYDVKASREPSMQAVRDKKLADLMRDKIAPKYFADPTDQKPLIDLCVEMAVGLGPDVFLRQSRALMDRPDQTETLRSTAIPALVLCGRHDKLCPLARHELMADLLPNPKLHIVEDAGHLPTLEQPNATNRALVDWLEG